MRSNDRNLRRRWLRRLAMALVLAMLSAMLPVAALAEEAGEETEIYEEPASEEQEAPDEVNDEPAEEQPGTDEGEESDPEPQQDPEETDVPAEEGEETPPEHSEDEEEEENSDEERHDDAEGQVVITGFLPLEKAEFKLSRKPELDLVLKNLPDEVTAEIPGFEDGVPFNVVWTCENYETEEYGDFLFTAGFADETAQIGDRIVPIEDVVLAEEVLMPVITVTVLAVSGFKPLEEDVYTLDGQPENERSAIKKMKLPKTVQGTLSDSDQVQSFPVTWECENFDGQSEEYLFTAVFSKGAYALEENVEMPAVLLLVNGPKVESFDAPEKQFFPVEAKPADEAAALAVMTGRGLAAKLKAKLVGSDTKQDVKVVWSCANYDAASTTGEYVFTAALAEGEEYDAQGVEMPTVTLKVISSTEFNIKLNEDETVTILGWTAPETATALVIPAAIGGCDVAEVADGAFKNHAMVTSVTLPDTLRKVSSSAFDAEVAPETVKLIVHGDTTLKSDTSFSQIIETEEVTTSLPEVLAVTDIQVVRALTFDCDYTICKGHGLEVDDGALVINNTGKTLVNHGAIVGTGSGTISNNGNIYSCQSGSTYNITVDEVGNAIEDDHVFDANGHCEHCNAKLLKVTFSGTITKTYDGSDKKTLTSDELSKMTITNIESGEDVRITGATATFNGAAAGSHTVTVEYEIDEGSKLYDYVKDALTANGTISKKEISDNSTITVDDISRQSRSGTDPSVSVYYNGTRLTQGTDYNVSYTYNSSTKVGTATITGIGNFTGSRTKTFDFDASKEDRTVTISLKKGLELTKVYDSTRNVSVKESNGTIRANLKGSDFEFSNVASGDTVRISQFGTVTYDDPNVGNRKVSITIKISQSSDKYNYVLPNGGTFTFDGKITPKTIEITPQEGQTKAYGAPDPSYFKGTVGNAKTGLMYDKDKGNISGKLGREAGENVGQYKYTTGTLTAGDNYTFVIAQVDGKDVTFSITPKDISTSDVSLNPSTIPNQKWTGSAIEPSVGLKYQDKTLNKGTDYTVKYENNVNAGLGNIVFTGMGNYQGTRKAQFRILKTAESSGINTSTNSSATVYGPSTSSVEGDSPTPGVTYHYMQYKATDSDDYILVSIRKKTVYFYHDGQYLSTDYSGDLADGVTVTFPGTDIELFVKLPSDLTGNPVVRVNNTKMTMTLQEDVDTDALIKLFAPAPTDEAIAEADEAAQLLGAMVIDGENLGTVLFGEDNRPRGFDLFEEEIISTEAEAPAEAEILPETALAEADAVAPNEEAAPIQMRLLIQPHAMTDVNGAPVYLDAEQTRKKYETMHLRLTNAQIESLKQRGFVELVYELENAQIRMPLEALTPDIDLANFREAEEETAPDELFTEEQPVAEELEPIDEDDPVGQLAEAAAQEADEVQIAPELLTVSMYDFFIDQVDDLSLTEREQKAMEGMYTLTPLYRVDINAVDGEFPAPELPEDAVTPQPVARPLPPSEVQPTLYSMLKVFNGAVEIDEGDGLTIEKNIEATGTPEPEPSPEAPVDLAGDAAETAAPAEADAEAPEADEWALGRAKLRVAPIETLDALPEDARALFVDSDGALLDEEAVTLSDPNYVVEELEGYAEFYPTASGLCALIAPVVVEEEEPETADEAFEAVEDEEAPQDVPLDEPADDTIGEEPAETEAAEVTATEAPEVNVIEDADPKYAYSRRSNGGDMIWLIDTQAKTVEFYRQDSGKYLIGDYTGSLMSGLTVKYRDTSEIVQMRLKFQQTYKFALTDVDGTEMLMEQDDVSMIESELNAVR